MNKTFSFASSPWTAYAPGDILHVNASARLDWLGTTLALIGFVATPDYRLMVYGTGGFAYGGGNGYLNVFDNLAGLAWHGRQVRHGSAGQSASAPICRHRQRDAESRIPLLRSRQQQLVTVANPTASAVFPGVYATAKYAYDGSISASAWNASFDRPTGLLVFGAEASADWTALMRVPVQVEFCLRGFKGGLKKGA